MLRIPVVPDDDREHSNTDNTPSSSQPPSDNINSPTSTSQMLRPNSPQSNAHLTDLPRSYIAETMHNHSNDSQIWNSRIDHQSLLDALHSESDEGMAGSQESTDSFDRDSIELADSDDNNNDDDDDDVGNAGSETLMELLSAQKDLEQQMRAIEQQEKDDEFQMPSFLRVMYMGAASEKDKRILLKKLSQAFATLFYYDSPSWLRSPKMFKERKHHLLLMSLVPDEDEDNLIETCEDNGLSIIEADFTWSTVSKETDSLTSMIEQYVWMQSEAARQDSSVWKAPRNAFDGFVYPDKAPNAIDLCVYFYDTSEKSKDRLRVEEDLAILWRLKRLGIPIMPILSGGAAPTRPTRHAKVALTVDQRRAQFADLLAQYKIRCVDISLSKLDVGRPPSFQKRKASPANTVPGLEERLGKDWAASSMTTPAPYQILTIDQFAALDRQAVFSILKLSRQKAIKREKVLNMIRTGECIPPLSDYDVSVTAVGTFRNKARAFVSILAFLLLLAIIIIYFVTAQPDHNKSWTLTAVVGMSDEASSKQSLSFVVELGDEKENPKRTSDSRYECVVALPTCISDPPKGPLVKLDVQFPYPINFTQINFHCPLVNLSEWQGSLEKPVPEAMASSSEAATPDDQASPHPWIWGYWKHIYHTTNYLFDHQSKIVNLVFNSK